MALQLEQMLVLAIVNNSEELHAEAQAHAQKHRLTQTQVNETCKRVMTFLRWHGLKKLFEIERTALIRIQSFFRMIYVRKQLQNRMRYWERLAKIDSIDHLQEAEQIYKVLQRPRPKKRRKICPFI